MTKTELTAAIAEVSRISKADASKFTDVFIDILTDALLHGDNVTLTGFGTFSIKDRAPRMGYNIKTKTAINIPASRAVCFTPSSALKEAIKNEK